MGEVSVPTEQAGAGDGRGQHPSQHCLVLRGGSWHNNPGGCRSAYRLRIQPDYAGYSVGFSVVCLPQGPSLNP